MFIDGILSKDNHVSSKGWSDRFESARASCRLNTALIPTKPVRQESSQPNSPSVST